MVRVFMLVCLLAFWCRGEDEKPRFEDYPVREVFRSTPAPPQLVTSWARHYRTVIRQGVAKGWGVQHGDKYDVPGPNYAGHYFVITWGCGTGCQQMVIVDAKTGRVHPPPLADGNSGDSRIMLRIEISGAVQVEYQLNSRLFMMHDCPPGYDHTKGVCDEVYFLMRPQGFRFLRRVPGEQFGDEPLLAPR